MLNSLELTGRAATHVRHVEELGCTLHEDAAQAALAMRHEARKAGLDLTVVSSYRDFKRQAAIWTAKFNGERRLLDRAGREISRAGLDEAGLVDAILIWSALPGASRHHWGTDFDVIDAAAVVPGTAPQLVVEEFAPGGCFEKLDKWLTEYMKNHGFFRPYGTDRGGVQPEPWHLSFGAVAGPALAGLTLRVVEEAIAGSEIPGRDGVLGRLPELYARYVLAVDEA